MEELAGVGIAIGTVRTEWDPGLVNGLIERTYVSLQVSKRPIHGLVRIGPYGPFPVGPARVAKLCPASRLDCICYVRASNSAQRIEQLLFSAEYCRGTNQNLARIHLLAVP